MTRRIDQEFVPLNRLIAAGLEDLLALQWEEVGETKDAVPLDVDWPALRCLEWDGILKCIGAWKGRELIGVAAFNVIAPRLSRGTKTAAEEVIFLLPEQRGFLGLGMIATAEHLLRGDGVKALSISSRPGFPGLGDVLVKLGYRPTEVIHTKVL